MKHLIILTGLLSFYLNSPAQERIDKKQPIISVQVLGQLQNATGWLNNPEGEWVSRKNRILSNLPHESKILLDYEQYGLGIDNFISYELRNIIINDTTYYILIKKDNSGYYKYRSIQEGWNNTKEIYYYIFNTSEVEQFQSLKPDTLQLLKIPILHSGQIQLLFSLDKYLTDIKKQVVKDWGTDKDYDNYLCINLQLLPKKDICRFLIFKYEESLYYASGFAGSDVANLIQDSVDNLKKMYFETSLNSFKNLFKFLLVE